MGILIKMAESRAIKKIARELPPFLVGGYGNCECYTVPQVERAMSETGCNLNFMDHALAMFCDRETFSSASEESYEALREAVGDVCFEGNADFTLSDASTYSSDASGFDSVGADGGDGGD